MAGPHPIDSSSCFSVFTFSWANELIRKAWRQKGLKDEDVWDVPSDEDCRTTCAALEAELSTQGANINTKKALFKVFRRPLIISGIMMLLNISSLLLGAFYFLSELLGWAGEDPRWRSAWRGWLFASLISVNFLITTLTHQLQFYFGLQAGIKMRGAVMAAVYRKATRISTVQSVGQVVNLISNDVQRLMELMNWFQFSWAGPVAVVLVTALASLRVGWSAIPGTAVIVILFGCQFYVGRQTQELRRKSIVVTDHRVRHMSEILTSIKMIKLYAWESSFSNSVSEIRDEEISYIRSAALWKSLNFGVFFAATNISMLLIFAINYWRGHELSARTAFVVVALLNTLRFPVVQFPVAVKALTDSTVSCNRLDEFFRSPDIEPSHDNLVGAQDAQGRAISFQQASFQWDAQIDDGINLHNVNLDVRSGKLLGVCGAVGAGKSTLLAAMLGQVRKVSGEMSLHGRVSFVSQQPWILNMSVKENILFGAVADELKYQRVLDACCLLPDLAMLPAGDRTEIGERGINLSGGQKARISLARAVYNDADVYLLDDPLSAVDQHVGKRLFTECICNLLRDKTVVLVTHQLQYLSKCAQVVFMVNGRIAGSGTFANLQRTNDEFRSLIDTYVGEPDPDNLRGSSKSHTPYPGRSPAVVAPSSGGLVMKEETNSSVGLGLYSTYVHFAGGIRVVVIAFGFFFLAQACNTFSGYWISIWSRDKLGLTGLQYLYILASLTGGYLLLSVTRGFFFVYLTLRAAKQLHNRCGIHLLYLTNPTWVFARVLMAPMYFFDSTPVGRILNRFSKDQEQIDDALPEALMTAVMYSFVIFATVTLIAIILPYFLVLLLPMGVLFVGLSYVYRFANRDIKRMESISRSPLFAHLSATLQGLSSIRAYRVEERFISENYAKINRSNAFYFHFYALGRWIALRLDLIAAAMIVSVAYYGIIVELDAGSYGLLMSQALAITGVIQWTVRAFVDTEANLMCVHSLAPRIIRNRSVERQMYYLKELPTEPPRKIPGTEPPADWPSRGGIEFDSVTMKYRSELEPVLRDVTFSVKPGEKIGIVGRTGAGKSSLSMTLFHMCLHAGGSVKIDGVDIFKIGLDDLRSRLAVIPQDPVMFVGTMRHNLDPHRAYPDVELWEALERVNLKAYVVSQQLKLEMEITENGENLSVGQRQLVCIARALLRKAKILFLDEATAAVDMATDQLIQQTLRSAFKHCTVFAIAHRLNTIIDSDKVLVMDGGRVAEFDHPATLLSNSDSKFSRLVAETGKSMARHLTKTAISRRAVLLLDEANGSDGEHTFTQAERKESVLRKSKQRIPEPSV